MVVNKVLYDAFLPFQGKEVIIWTTKKNGPQEIYICQVHMAGLDVKVDRQSCVRFHMSFHEIQKIRELI